MRYGAVVGNQLEKSEAEITIPVIVSEIPKKDASRILKTLVSDVPLQLYQLEHLKRIRSGTGATDMLEIIVCPVVSFHDISAEVRNLLGAFREVLVSRCPPTNRDEFNKFGSYWPVNYRPRQPEHVELLSPLENDLFDEYFQDVIRIGKDLYHLTGKDDIGAIVVNPMNKKVVSTSLESMIHHINTLGRDAAICHPLLTPTMLCINGVSLKVQNLENETNLLPEDQYLCTGLDLYIFKEPDLLSSMALVHSRIRRVVYLVPDRISGCLESRTSIHLIKSLNHHFEVFKRTEISSESLKG